MTKKEKNDVIKFLINEIKKQKDAVVNTLECKNMDEINFAYYKQGFSDGIDIAIYTLQDEL